MPRNMTPAEKQKFRGYFPSLNVDQAVVTGEASGVYNCLSWTLGITDRWVWPGATVQAFDQLYNGAGFIRAGNGPIAAWGQSLTQMTHGCVSGPVHGPRWESKCGSDLRIQHGLNELTGASYGRVLAFYAPRNTTTKTLVSRMASRSRPKRKVSLSAPETANLRKEVGVVPPELRREFERLYNEWRDTWREPHLAILSDPAVLRYSREFAAVAALGPEILPLVVEKLANREEFFALQLYDALQSHGSLKVEIEPDLPDVLEGEQGRAERVVKHWLSR
jgi:hypothetical protein